MVNWVGSGGLVEKYVDDGTPGPEPDADGKTTLTLEITTFYIGLVCNSKRLDFGWEIQDFEGLIHQWDSYDEEKMWLSLNFTKRNDLPDNVYDGNPRPPNRKRKKKQKVVIVDADSSPGVVEEEPVAKKVNSSTNGTETPEEGFMEAVQEDEVKNEAPEVKM
jgi:poly(A) polymerase Pap1